MLLDRSALDSLFSRSSHWPSYGDLDCAARGITKHLIEHPKTGLLMALVPKEKFLTNSDGLRVELPTFYVGVHPVTNAQYTRFVAETGHRPPDNRIWQEAGKMHHPVVCVDWDDATAYCLWAELRLPTELEWEKAARGLDRRTYPWGNRWNPNRCRNYLNKGSETTAGVWRYGQGGSPFGGLQLSGNVWEWCADRYTDTAYARCKQGNPATPSSGQSRVVRGGSWCSDGSDFFSVLRRRQGPDLCDDYFGFRCVSDLAASP